MLTILASILGISLIVTLSSKSMSIGVFIGMLVIGLSFLVVWVYLSMTHNQEKEAALEKGKFPYCWRQMNKMLSDMPGGDQIQWWGGRGRTSVVKSYIVGKKTKDYRSMYGWLSKAKQGIVIIWNITDEDLVGYWANPNPTRINNPFENWSPQDNASLFSRGFNKGKGKGGKSGGITIQYDSGSSGGGYEPDNDLVDKASPGDD